MGPLTITLLAMAAGGVEGKQAEPVSVSPPPLRPVNVPPPAPPPVIARPRPTGPNLKPTPLGSTSSYVGSWDYPAKALREERSGSTTVDLTVSRWGSVADCRVTSSSGHEDLDSAACERLATRARFWPATDAKGEPTTGIHSQTVRWALPETPNPATMPPPIIAVPVPASTELFPRPPRLRNWGWARILDTDWPAGAREAKREGETKVSFAIDSSGHVTTCRVLKSSGHVDLDARSCAIVRERTRFDPALGVDGLPTAGSGEQVFDWREPKPLPSLAPPARIARPVPMATVLPAFLLRPGKTTARMTLDKDGKTTSCTVTGEGGMERTSIAADTLCKDARQRGFRTIDSTGDQLPQTIEVSLEVKTVPRSR